MYVYTCMYYAYIIHTVHLVVYIHDIHTHDMHIFIIIKFTDSDCCCTTWVPTYILMKAILQESLCLHSLRLNPTFSHSYHHRLEHDCLRPVVSAF